MATKEKTIQENVNKTNANKNNGVPDPITKNNNEKNKTQKVLKNSKGDIIDSSEYFLPPPTVINTWNTKRLLPHVLLGQYTPFVSLFLIDSTVGSMLTSENLNESNSILLGAPTDTAMQLTNDYYSNLSNFESFTNSPVSASTLYYSDSVKDGRFKVHSIGGINAKIKGFLDGNSNHVHKIIPLTTKLSQLVQPDGKNIVEITDCSVETLSINGYLTANITLKVGDVHQFFSRKAAINRLFQNFTKYLLVFGWQGPSVQNIEYQLQQQPGVQSTQQTSPSTIDVQMYDDGSGQTDIFTMTFPSQFVNDDGTLNMPIEDNAYLFDIDDTDNGNRVVLPLYAITPDISYQYPNIIISFKASNAGQGMAVNEMLATLFGGSATEILRSDLLKKVNDLKPIAHYDISSFFDPNNQGSNFDAESQQDLCKTFQNEIDNAVGKSTFGNVDNIIVNENDTSNIDNNPAPIPPPNNNKKVQNADVNKTEVTNAAKLNINSLQIKSGVNLNGLTDNSIREINRLDNFILNNPSLKQNGIDVIITSAKDSHDNVISKHNTGKAIDIATRPKGKEQDLAILLRSNGFDSHFESAGQLNANGGNATADHIHINTDSGAGTFLNAPITGIGFIPPSPEEGDSSDTFDNIKIDNVVEPNNTIVKEEEIKSVAGKLPAAYRLGDIITALLESVNDITDKTKNGTLNSVKAILSNIFGDSLFLGKKITDLTSEDVFVSKSILKKTNQFVDELKNKLKDKNIAGEDITTLSDLLNDEYFGNISNVLGYEIVAETSSDPQSQKFKNFLTYFRDIMCSNKYNQIKDKKIPLKNVSAFRETKDKVFVWNSIDGYDGSEFTYPITPADLPISTDTLSRALQIIATARRPEDIINNVLSLVSNDYGFTLRLYHVTPGAKKIDAERVKTDFENPRSQFYDLKRVENTKINIIIDDEFLTDNKISDQVEKYLNLENTATSKSFVPNQFFGKDFSMLDSKISNSIQNQFDIIKNEYSSKKINKIFLIDYGTIHSLVKSINFSKIDVNNMATQLIYSNIHNSYQQYNGMFVPGVLSNQSINDIIQNFSSIQSNISNYLINTEKLMPGKPEYEAKFTKLLQQMFNEIEETIENQNSTENNNSKFDQFVSSENQNKTDTNAKLNDIITIINKEKNNSNSPLKEEKRKEFLSNLLASYLYQRPLGVKYSYFLGKSSMTIHGTSGMGFSQGIYLRGMAPQLEGVYRIYKLVHTINMQSASWETGIEAALISSPIVNEINKNLVNSKITNNNK